MRVGFIGLGSQGGPMARRIVEAGHETTLWARREATLEPYRDTDANFAASPAELAAAADLVCLCVVNDADVEEVFAALAPGLSAGAIVAIQSTVHPGTCTRLAEAAATHGATVIDAPVSGGGHMAAEGRLLVMTGGDPDAYERARPVFATYGDPVVHLGPLGSGQLAKLVNNVLFTAHLTLADDALSLGEAWGLDRAALGQVLTGGSAQSYALPIVAGMGIEALQAVAAPLLRKDVDIVTALATETDASTGALVDTADRALTRMRLPPRTA